MKVQSTEAFAIHEFNSDQGLPETQNSTMSSESDANSQIKPGDFPDVYHF